MPPYVAAPTTLWAAHLAKAQILAVGDGEQQIAPGDAAHLGDIALR